MFQIDSIEIIGLIAATLTTIAYVPQVIKTWKTKDVSTLSLTMYIIMFLGVSMWFAYGILLKSIAIILANIVTGILTFILILLKLKYRGKK
ncbi:MAG: SemiSWEET transporter [Flavobacteriaceae bacterium]|nr:SemiSWEET transporter [Flavobacteriaceae bacterium]